MFAPLLSSNVQFDREQQVLISDHFQARLQIVGVEDSDWRVETRPQDRISILGNLLFEFSMGDLTGRLFVRRFVRFNEGYQGVGDNYSVQWILDYEDVLFSLKAAPAEAKRAPELSQADWIRIEAFLTQSLPLLPTLADELVESRRCHIVLFLGGRVDGKWCPEVFSIEPFSPGAARRPVMSSFAPLMSQRGQLEPFTSSWVFNAKSGVSSAGAKLTREQTGESLELLELTTNSDGHPRALFNYSNGDVNYPLWTGTEYIGPGIESCLSIVGTTSLALFLGWDIAKARYEHISGNDAYSLSERISSEFWWSTMRSAAQALWAWPREAARGNIVVPAITLEGSFWHGRLITYRCTIGLRSLEDVRVKIKI